ncbi:MAG: glycosyltransferase family 2 protein [Bdellovibrionales bacterium]
MPVVTVLIAVLNGAQTVRRAIASAQEQSEKDIEILIVDDGSTDNTAEIIQNLAARDPRIRLVRMEQNQGAAAASNIGIEQAQGEWIAILDSDDWWKSKRLETLLATASQTNADVVCDNLEIYDHMRKAIVEQTRFCANNRPFVLDTETYFKRDNPLWRHSIGYIQPVMRRDFLRKHKVKYNVSHRFGFDFIFVAELLLHKAKLVVVPDAMYVYVHRISPTTRKISPFSRSEAGHAMIVRGCRELLKKYSATMTPDERKALEERRSIFEARVKCDDLLQAVEKFRLLDAARQLMRTPMMIVLIIATLAKLVYANVLSLNVMLKKHKKQPLFITNLT